MMGILKWVFGMMGICNLFGNSTSQLWMVMNAVHVVATGVLSRMMDVKMIEFDDGNHWLLATINQEHITRLSTDSCINH